MNQPDIQKLMEQAQKMQQRMNALQQELAAKRFEASADPNLAISLQLQTVGIRVAHG